MFDRRHTVEHVEYERGGDVVRQVGDEVPPSGALEPARPRQVEGIGLHEGGSRVGTGQDLVEHGDQVPVELDGGHVRPGFDQGEGQRAQAGTDLDHPVAGADARQPDDAPDSVRVDDEVLAQGPARADIVAVEKILRLSPGDHPDSLTAR